MADGGSRLHLHLDSACPRHHGQCWEITCDACGAVVSRHAMGALLMRQTFTTLVRHRCRHLRLVG